MLFSTFLPLKIVNWRTYGDCNCSINISCDFFVADYHRSLFALLKD